LWAGVRLGNDSFIGPNVTFCNDLFPRSKKYLEEYLITRVEEGASIGAGATILPGITIGSHAMVGAGAVVTQSVPPYAIVVGNPSKIIGYVNSRSIANSKFEPKKSEPESIVKGVICKRLSTIFDMRGDLTVGEFQNDIPFLPKRFFLVYDVPSEKTRGAHAHIKCEQFLVCIKGKCSLVVDDGLNRDEIELHSPELGVFLPAMTWGIQYKYSADAVLLVFASEYYSADDYIRNYDEFLMAVKNTSPFSIGG
jgi:hypothetical protein